MTYRIKQLMVAAFVSLAIPFAFAGLALAAPTPPPPPSPIEQGINATCTGSNCTTPENADAKVNTLVQNVISIFSWVVGVVSVIVIIFGGFRYITSGGDAGKVTSAKNTILYALVGLVIAALAQIIVLFVLGNVTATPKPEETTYSNALQLS